MLRIRILLFLIIAISYCHGFLDSFNPDGAPFKMRNTHDDERGILAKSKLEERRNFFHLFNVPYIVCFFAAKGKWPFIPSYMQVQVDQVGRTLFPQSDSFIRNYCQKWIHIKECFRPHNIIPVHPAPEPQPVTDPPEPINTEVETFPTEPPTTPCSCAQRMLESGHPAPVVFFDKNYVGNVSAETIVNTIEFLQNFLPPTTKKPKRKNKIRGRVISV